ncbi:MAG: ATP-dependent sacrificial sulfur transferase LarE [Myxococcota bacterium]
MNASVERRLDQLRDHMRGLGSVLVCYSGGVDSAFVLAIAHEVLGARAVGMTAISPSLPRSERELAVEVALAIGADHRIVDTAEIDDPNYVRNGPDRCFYCKSELYRVAALKREQWGLAHVLNGTNADDLGDYRPGLQAATEAGVASPLVDLGFSKDDVRDVARAIGLGVWDKPASACLASRIPFGTSVTRARLAQVEGLEAELRRLGFRQLRVRYHDTIARIELGRDELGRAAEPEVREEIVAAGKAHGFKYVTLDLGGYRMGSHNEVLVGRSLRLV